MVRLAQPFNSPPAGRRQGNFGNIDGDNPAAYRHTSAHDRCRAPPARRHRRDGVEFRPNYDGQSKEPVVARRLRTRRQRRVGLRSAWRPRSRRTTPPSQRGCAAPDDKPDAKSKSLLNGERAGSDRRHRRDPGEAITEACVVAALVPHPCPVKQEEAPVAPGSSSSPRSGLVQSRLIEKIAELTRRSRRWSQTSDESADDVRT